MKRGDDHYHLHDIEEIRFDFFPGEIRAAAASRAGEDSTSTVRVLAGWLWQAGSTSNDYLADSAGSVFYEALRDHIEESDPDDDWALCYDGDPERWRNDEAPITTLDEAADYARGGYQWVIDARKEDE
jgi:hypothetical protein